MTMARSEAASALVAIAISELRPIHRRVPPVSMAAVKRVLPHFPGFFSPVGEAIIFELRQDLCLVLLFANNLNATKKY